MCSRNPNHCEQQQDRKTAPVAFAGATRRQTEMNVAYRDAAPPTGHLGAHPGGEARSVGPRPGPVRVKTITHLGLGLRGYQAAMSSDGGDDHSSNESN